MKELGKSTVMLVLGLILIVLGLLMIIMLYVSGPAIIAGLYCVAVSRRVKAKEDAEAAESDSS